MGPANQRAVAWLLPRCEPNGTASAHDAWHGVSDGTEAQTRDGRNNRIIRLFRPSGAQGLGVLEQRSDEKDYEDDEYDGSESDDHVLTRSRRTTKTHPPPVDGR